MFTFKVIFIGAALLAFVVVYAVIIHTYLQVHAQATAKAAVVSSSTGLSKLWAMLSGWKTLICQFFAAIFAMVAAIPSDTVTAWGTLPWANVIDQKTAALVTIVFAFIGGITHAQGVAAAATTPPQQGS